MGKLITSFYVSEIHLWRPFINGFLDIIKDRDKYAVWNNFDYHKRILYKQDKYNSTYLN